MHLDDFAMKFENDLSLVSFLSTNKATRSAWFLDNGAYLHMTEARYFFRNMMKRD
jgi:hypothetical protein